jgi:stage V sporulation protein SpoVS
MAAERHPAEVLKVSTRSRPSAVAGAIAGVIRDSGMAEVQSIGAGATNQAIKAVAIARSYLSHPSSMYRSMMRSAPRFACWSSVAPSSSGVPKIPTISDRMPGLINLGSDRFFCAEAS